MLLCGILTAVLLFSLFLFGPPKRIRRYNRIVRMRRARCEERRIGEIFLNLANERQQDIKCQVYGEHRLWGSGYHAWVQDLCEPGTPLSIEINFFRKEKKRIKIETWTRSKYFPGNCIGVIQATFTFKRGLDKLVQSNVSVVA